MENSLMRLQALVAEFTEVDSEKWESDSSLDYDEDLDYDDELEYDEE